MSIMLRLKAVSVFALDDSRILAEVDTGERKIMDVMPYIKEVCSPILPASVQ